MADPLIPGNTHRMLGFALVNNPVQNRIVAVGLAATFLCAVWLVSNSVAAGLEHRTLIVFAGVIGGYMALNIGANDVANNVGPAFGSGSLNMVGALIIAAVFETAGALIAGGDVVSTISKGIIDAGLIADAGVFASAMLAALLAAALWVNLATYIRAPVSTTHAVVGGVMGAGIAAAGISVVNWDVMSKIAASWVISPALGGIFAALFLAFIRARILRYDDKLAQAKRWVPILVSLMAGVFSAYLVAKGLKKVWKPDVLTIAAIGCAVFAGTLTVVRPWIRRRAEGLENRTSAVRGLFHLPLICAAALLSFAHGANDVANAIGPLAAIIGSVSADNILAEVEIPTWVLFVGAAGITIGLLLFGPRLIRTVGTEITRLNPLRAYCVAISAAFTVIVASALGLPVSSTHIAVGAIFGVGFYREFRSFNGGQKANPQARRDGTQRKSERRKLVRRHHAWTIVTAWLVTVPLSALLAGGVFSLMQSVIH